MRRLLFFLFSGVLSSVALADAPTHHWLVQSDDFADEMSPIRRADIERMLLRNRLLLPRHVEAMVLPAQIAPASLQWPLAANANFIGFDYHGISNFVDHDARFPGFVTDYSCGTRSYDNAAGYNHAGTDYFLWPYPWLMMDQQQVAIVAAAPGVIVGKSDGNFDRSCAMGNAEWNAVYVQHADNTVAWYGHMKSGSLTNKLIGANVAAGELLGFVGSSGSSTAPHLHFELHAVNGDIIDPRHGQCNASADLWAVMQPYEEPTINALSTHSVEPEFVACGVANGQPEEENPAYQDAFEPGATLWVFAAYHDQRNGEITHFSIQRPDHSIWQAWDFDLASEGLPKPFYSGTGWDWSYVLPADAPLGMWTLNAEFQGQTYTHAFTVGSSKSRDLAAVAAERARIAVLLARCRGGNLPLSADCISTRHP